MNGISADRIIGFEGLGHGDNFTTMDLEARLLGAGVLTRAKVTDEDGYEIGKRTSRKQQHEEEDDDDWD